MDHLSLLESESIYVLREVAAQFRKPVLLFSGGKDSTVVAKLAEKAFKPAIHPFKLMHVDTGHNFEETISFRDSFAAKTPDKLIVRKVQDSIDQGRTVEPKGPDASRNAIQSVTLLDAIAEFQFDAVIGGARRDEEKARAKERFFSFRDEFGQWDPRNQRPELWSLYNGKVRQGENMRVFPLSNWTELDVWRYIEREAIELPTIYFAHKRKCVRRKNGTLLSACDYVKAQPGDKVEELTVRCRTVGDVTCTGLLESKASNITQIMTEIVASRTTERGSRMDDQVSDSAMEDRKKQGYF
jgi:sulfate adenylyltransferase subunit 2